MEYKRLSRCGIDNCKQTLFYPENGRWFCKNGHMREGEVEMEADDEGFGQTGSRATRAKVETKRVSKVLRGRKGFALYIQCYQFLLQKQVWWLVKEKGFPEELEVIVRDLWALRLQILSSTLPKHTSQSQPGSRTQSEQPNQDVQSSHSSYIYTSESDIASTTRSAKKRRQKRVPIAADRPTLIESLALCYLGLVLLRSAVSLRDFHRWVESQGLIYIRAIKEVPEAMKDKLSGEYWTAMDPRAGLRRGRLYKTVHNTVVMMHEKFGITFPPINREVLLAGIINDLGLPLEIYTATKRLADRPFMTFEWPALALTKRTSHWPEAKLMALVIIATKLCFGLDGIRRTPHSPTEPAATALAWNAWEHFLRAGNQERRGLLISKGGKNAQLEVDVKEADIFSMDAEELDWYMDWYEKTWCAEGEVPSGERGLSQGIMNLFPATRRDTPPPPPSEQERGYELLPSRLHTLHAETAAIRAVRDKNEELCRPGEEYLLYSLDEEVPHQLRTLMQAAADLLAIDRQDLQKVVSNVEHILKEQVVEKRRNDRKRGKIVGAIASGKSRARGKEDDMDVEEDVGDQEGLEGLEDQEDRDEDEEEESRSDAE